MISRKFACTSYKFLDKNISMSTVSGFEVALNDGTTFPAALKNLSEAELVANILKYFCATFSRLG